MPETQGCDTGQTDEDKRQLGWKSRFGSHLVLLPHLNLSRFSLTPLGLVKGLCEAKAWSLLPSSGHQGESQVVPWSRPGDLTVPSPPRPRARVCGPGEV